MNEHQSHIRDKILAEIHKGEVSMTPRAYFTLKLVATGAIALGVLIVSVFVFNFLYFSIRISGHGALLGFGPRGFEAFVRFFPWELFIIDVALVVLLQWLLRQFRSGYKIPVLYLLVALLVCAALLGFALEETSLNDRFVEHPEKLPPPFGVFYDHARRPPPPGSGICRCTILAIQGNTLVVSDSRAASTSLRVVLPDNDDHATTTGLHVGDTIFIAGDEDDGEIRAFGVHKEQSGNMIYEIEVKTP